MHGNASCRLIYVVLSMSYAFRTLFVYMKSLETFLIILAENGRILVFMKSVKDDLDKNNRHTSDKNDRSAIITF